MFLGTYNAQLSEGSRLSIPGKIRREIMGKDIILAIGFEVCIFGFNRETWNEVVKPELEKPFFSDKHARDMRRKMSMNAEVVTVDAQGRIVIPETMLTYARITASVVVIGSADHFELWSRDSWENYANTL